MKKHILLLLAAMTLTWHQPLLAEERKAKYKVDGPAMEFMELGVMFRAYSGNYKAQMLASAAGRGRIKRVNRLVERGADVNARGTSNATPLFWAMRNIDGFRRLLELGADPNAVYDDGSALMHWVVFSEDGERLKLALQHGGNPSQLAAEYRDTPLFKAAWRGRKRAAQLLLNAGADINFQSIGGSTPVIRAVDHRQFELAYMLLELGADHQIRRFNGRSLADAMSGHTSSDNQEQSRWRKKIIDWLKVRGVEIPKWRPDFYSVESTFTDPLDSALAVAVFKRQTDEVVRLVSLGADVNARGLDNITPLIRFQGLHNNIMQDMERLLLALGADPNLVDDRGRSYIHKVAYDSAGDLKLTLKHGGDPNLVAGIDHATPLFSAIRADDEVNVSLLLEAGTDINFQNVHGMTPAMLAARLYRYDMVHRFLELGADYRLETRDSGKTLMDFIACNLGYRAPTVEIGEWRERVVDWLAERKVAIPDECRKG